MDRRRFLQGLIATGAAGPVLEEYFRSRALHAAPTPVRDYAFSAPEDKARDRATDAYPKCFRNRPNTCVLETKDPSLRTFVTYLKGVTMFDDR